MPLTEEQEIERAKRRIENKAPKRQVVNINFVVPDELAAKMKRLPWGMRSLILRIMLERIMKAHDKHGDIILDAILSGEWSISYEPKKRRK